MTSGDQHRSDALLARMAGDVAALARRVSDVEGQLEDIAVGFDAIESLLDPPPAPRKHTEFSDAPTDQPGAPALDMRRLVAWVRDNVALLLERKVPQTGGQPYWCRRWWLHPEAIARFEAVRRSWEDAVAAPGAAMVVYFEHLDHHLAVLCGEAGPFSGCPGGQHRDDTSAGPLGQDDPDESYFLALDDHRLPEPPVR